MSTYKVPKATLLRHMNRKYPNNEIGVFYIECVGKLQHQVLPKMVDTLCSKKADILAGTAANKIKPDFGQGISFYISTLLLLNFPA